MSTLWVSALARGGVGGEELGRREAVSPLPAWGGRGGTGVLYGYTGRLPLFRTNKSQFHRFYTGPCAAVTLLVSGYEKNMIVCFARRQAHLGRTAEGRRLEAQLSERYNVQMCTVRLYVTVASHVNILYKFCDRCTRCKIWPPAAGRGVGG